MLKYDTSASVKSYQLVKVIGRPCAWKKFKFGITTTFGNWTISSFWGRAHGKSLIFVLRWFLKFVFDYSFKGANAGCCLPAACCCLPAACCCLLLLAAAYLLPTCCCSAAAHLLLACCLLLTCCLPAAAHLLFTCCSPAACLLLPAAACCCLLLAAACRCLLLPAAAYLLLPTCCCPPAACCCCCCFLMLLPYAATAAGANILPKKKIIVSVALFGAGGRYGRETSREIWLVGMKHCGRIARLFYCAHHLHQTSWELSTSLMHIAPAIDLVAENKGPLCPYIILDHSSANRIYYS